MNIFYYINVNLLLMNINDYCFHGLLISGKILYNFWKPYINCIYICRNALPLIRSINVGIYVIFLMSIFLYNEVIFLLTHIQNHKYDLIFFLNCKYVYFLHYDYYLILKLYYIFLDNYLKYFYIYNHIYIIF